MIVFIRMLFFAFLVIITISCQNSKIDYIDILELPLKATPGVLVENGFTLTERELDGDRPYKLFDVEKRDVLFKYKDYEFRASMRAPYLDTKQRIASIEITNNLDFLREIERRSDFICHELKNDDVLCSNYGDKVIVYYDRERNVVTISTF